MDINKFFDGVDKNKKLYILDIRHKEYLDEYTFNSLTSEVLCFKKDSNCTLTFDLKHANIAPVLYEEKNWFLQIQGGCADMYYNVFIFKTKKLAKKIINMHIEAETERLEALSNLVNKNTPNFYKLINAFIGHKKDKINKNI